MRNAHPLISFLQCPVTKTALSYIELDDDTALLSEGGIVYPIINGVIVMKPVSRVVREKCIGFLSRHDANLRKLGNSIDLSKTQHVLVDNSGCHEPSWHEDEMAYWESVFHLYGSRWRWDVPWVWLKRSHVRGYAGSHIRFSPLLTKAYPLLSRWILNISRSLQTYVRIWSRHIGIKR